MTDLTHDYRPELVGERLVARRMVVAVARSYKGTKFHHQGRVPGVGLDCAGVPIALSWELGIKPRTFDVMGYPRTPDGVSLKRYCDEQMTEIAQTEMQIGDVVLVRWRDGEPQHLGIVADHAHGGLSMIHADSIRQHCVIETALRFGAYMRFVAAYRLPGVG